MRGSAYVCVCETLCASLTSVGLYSVCLSVFEEEEEDIILVMALPRYDTRLAADCFSPAIGEGAVVRPWRLHGGARLVALCCEPLRPSPCREARVVYAHSAHAIGGFACVVQWVRRSRTDV